MKAEELFSWQILKFSYLIKPDESKEVSKIKIPSMKFHKHKNLVYAKATGFNSHTNKIENIKVFTKT